MLRFDNISLCSKLKEMNKNQITQSQINRLKLEKTPSQLFSKSLTHIKYTQLIIHDLDKCKENNINISQIHMKKIYLLNSYIVNLVALWQVFIENLLKYAVEGIVKVQSDTRVINILNSNLKINLKRFNTPNTQNIDNLFQNVLSIDKVTDSLKYKDMGIDKVKGEVTRILKIRHKIAHTGYSNERLDIDENFQSMYFLLELSRQLEYRVEEYIKQYDT